MKIRVRVKPGSKRGDQVVQAEPYIDVFLSAKPVDGKANEALIALLAKHFGVSRDQVRIISGATARLKLVEIGGPEGT